MSTPHNNASVGDIADLVLMPGDPLRAKYIAENFLENVKQFNEVRNMFGFTGEYKGKKISVMGSGMGIPSIGIYSYELYTQYNVKSIIRIGTSGALVKDLKIGDLVFAQGASTDSNYAKQYELMGTFAPIATFDLLEKAVNIAKEKNIKYVVGNVLSSDVFYSASKNATLDFGKKMGVLAVEMESAALYMNAAHLGKKALGLFTISDSLVTGEASSAEFRQNKLNSMIEVALETAIQV